MINYYLCKSVISTIYESSSMIFNAREIRRATSPHHVGCTERYATFPYCPSLNGTAPHHHQFQVINFSPDTSSHHRHFHFHRRHRHRYRHHRRCRRHRCRGRRRRRRHRETRLLALHRSYHYYIVNFGSRYDDYLEDIRDPIAAADRECSRARRRASRQVVYWLDCAWHAALA